MRGTRGSVRVVTVPVVLLALLALLMSMVAGCDDEGGSSSERTERAEPTERPDEYADYLLARDLQRRIVPELVDGLDAEVGGRVDVLTARYETCGREDDETYAFGHSVTAVVRDAPVEPGLSSVVAVLEGQGWTVTEDPHLDQGVQFVKAERDGVRVTINEGRPASVLLVRAGGGCFDVPEEDRDELRDLDDDRLRIS